MDNHEHRRGRLCKVEDKFISHRQCEDIQAFQLLETCNNCEFSSKNDHKKNIKIEVNNMPSHQPRGVCEKCAKPDTILVAKGLCSSCYKKSRKDNKDDNQRVILIFSEEDKDLFDSLKKLSKNERRTIQQQILYFIDKGLK